MIRKKLLRLSLALLAAAAMFAAAPKEAMALGGTCASWEYITDPIAGDDNCSLDGPSGDCSNCMYYCPLFVGSSDYPDGIVIGNFCAD